MKIDEEIKWMRRADYYEMLVECQKILADVHVEVLDELYYEGDSKNRLRGVMVVKAALMKLCGVEPLI